MVGSRSPLNIPYRRPFYARTRFLFIGFLIIVIYSYGWRVTEIELGSLVRDAHLVKPLLRDFLNPDILTFKKKENQRALFLFYPIVNFHRALQKKILPGRVCFCQKLPVRQQRA